jgi:hypothetical protein
MTGHLFHVTQRTPAVSLWKAKGVISRKGVGSPIIIVPYLFQNNFFNDLRLFHVARSHVMSPSEKSISITDTDHDSLDGSWDRHIDHSVDSLSPLDLIDMMEFS